MGFGPEEEQCIPELSSLRFEKKRVKQDPCPRMAQLTTVRPKGPKRARPSYLWLFAERRRDPDVTVGETFGDVCRKVAQEWEQMSDKEKLKYRRLGLLDHVRYCIQMDDLRIKGSFRSFDVDLYKLVSELPQQPPAKDWPELKLARVEKGEGMDLNGCVICYEFKSNLQFQPCQHQLVCSRCHLDCKLRQCPLCQTPIESTRDPGTNRWTGQYSSR